MLVRRVAPRAERETIANAVREVYALQEDFVRVGSVEVARAALKLRCSLSEPGRMGRYWGVKLAPKSFCAARAPTQYG